MLRKSTTKQSARALITIVLVIATMLPALGAQAAPPSQSDGSDGIVVPGQAANQYLADKIGSYADLTVTDHHGEQPAATVQAARQGGGQALASDEFARPNLDPQWQVVNPLQDGWLAINNGSLQLSVPRGASHDPWNFNRAMRVMQAVNGQTLALETHFTTMPTTAFQMQGLTLEQDLYNWLRYEVLHDGNALQLVTIATVEGVSTVKQSIPLPAASAIRLRVERSGASWQFTYSTDGQEWQPAAAFTHSLQLTAVGPHVANHSAMGAAPAFTAGVAYVRNLNDETVAAAQQQLDQQGPTLHGVQSFATGNDLTLRWYTDEPSSSSVAFGSTSAHGTDVAASGDGFAHTVTIPALNAGQRYHYRIVATDATGNSSTQSDSLTFAPSDTVGPTINIWYGDQQSYGQKGQPQRWANILGNVSDPDGVVSLRYTLNGGPSRKLSIGPDGRRLANIGDFNVDLLVADLVVGNNTVVITAIDSQDNISTRTVTLNYQPTTVQPSYTIDWSTITNTAQIQGQAHSIDGKWALDSGKVRTAEPGYDRMLGFGDIGWNDYEILAPITVHTIPEGNHGIGFVLRWTGATDNPRTCNQPKCGWLPLGTIAWYTNGNLQLYVDGDTRLDSQKATLEEGMTYWFRARVETNPDGGLYSLRVWPEGQPEPGTWNVQGQSTLDQPQRGAPSFAVHRADVSVGNITVLPIGLSNPLQNFPPTANNDSAAVAPGSTTYVNVLTNDTDAGGLLDPSSIQIETQPQNGTVQVNTLTGQITYVHDGSATASDSFTYSVRDDGTLQGDGVRSTPATVNLTVTEDVPSTVRSDDFSQCSLHESWSFINPLGEGSFDLVGAGTADAYVEFALPAGVSHNAWGDEQNEAIRIMQDVTNSDFEVEASFTTEPTGDTNNQGIIVEQNSGTFLRFDVFHNGTSLKAFAGSSIDGNHVPIKSSNIITGTGTRLRLNRTGNSWTMDHWTGADWQQITTFDQALTVTKVGVFAANAGGAAYTTGVDYIFDTAAPIDPEDGSRNLLTTATQGDGSVITSPSGPEHACSELVELTAQPAAGFKFVGWSGALSGDANPSTLEIEGSATVTATFVLSDTDATAPEITLLGDNPLVLPVNGTYTDPGATAQDDVDGDISGQIVVGGDVVDTSTPGSYTVTYDVTDASDNKAVQKKRVVIVTPEDNTPPVITLTGESTINLAVGATWTDPGATAQDDVDGDLTSEIVVGVLGGGTVDTSKPGSFTITYDVADSSGNDATQVRRTVNVVDDIAPVITLTGDAAVQIEAGNTWNDPGATAQDNIDGDITDDIVTDVVGGGPIDISKPGTYTITYNVSDSSGNAATPVTRTLEIVDTTPPVLTLVGDNPVRLEVGATYTEAGATATDSVDGSLTSEIVIGGDTVDTSTEGVYTVTYDVSDSSGNKAPQLKRTVIVGAAEPPEMRIFLPLISK